MLKDIIVKNCTFRNNFILIGILIQVITFYFTSSNLLSLISGCTGVISVVLCSDKKISMYTFGLIQLLTYIILCWGQLFYAEILENLFYLVTMIIGFILWRKNYDKDENNVYVKKIESYYYPLYIILIILCSFVLGAILQVKTNDTQPFLDAFSTFPAIIAQILMILRYKEQWYCWLIVDILTCILWINAQNWCMVAQYIFWTANCIYGLKKWQNI